MPNFNFLTVEETRKAAQEKRDRDIKIKAKEIAEEAAVKNNAKKGKSV